MSSFGWIHNFTITDTCIVKNRYTVYKITSIVFNRNIPEALSTISVWKRFSEVKELYKEIETKSKRLHLKGDFPLLKQTNFFNRFEAAIIEERKKFILDLLYFIAQHPALYSTKSFSDFLRNGHSPNISPKHDLSQNSILLPTINNKTLPSSSNSLMSDEHESHIFDVPLQTNGYKSSHISSALLKPDISNGPIESDSKTALYIPDNTLSSFTPPTYSNYICEAALEFSTALEEEVNRNFEKAFAKYKTGIECLLSGVKTDENPERKQISKTKIDKYLKKAEYIYDNYISTDKRNVELNSSSPTSSEFSIDTLDGGRSIRSIGSTAVSCLERPISQLSKLKVVKIINSVMQVLDVTNKNCYIMKVIPFKASSIYQKTVILSKNIPYMVQIVQYYKTENFIYILLKQACGGRLWDYIDSYNVSSEKHNQNSYINSSTYIPYDQLKETKEDINETIDIQSHNQTKYDRISSIDEDQNFPTTSNVEKDEQISIDMEIDDILNYSNKLINSVSETLNKVMIKDVNVKEIEEQIPKQPDAVGNESLITMKHISRVSYEKCKAELDKKSISGVPRMEQINLPECSVRQWAKELVVAVEELHKNNIVCGDLNMDNLLLGSDGQLQLTFFYRRIENDLEFDVQCNKPNYCSYVAPERPLTMVSDWWSVGVIIFELLCLKPFQTCHPGEIVNYCDTQFPDVDISEEAKDLIQGLLQIDPIERFDVIQIKTHPFFKDTNWEDVSRKGYNFI